VKKFADDPQHAFPGHGQMKPEQLEIARIVIPRRLCLETVRHLAETDAPMVKKLKRPKEWRALRAGRSA
jgi:hypothetical protein